MRHFILLMLMLFPHAAHANAQEGTLPPHVQKYPASIEKKQHAMLLLYTNDSPQKVIAFYQQSLGLNPEKDDQGNEGFFVGEDHLGEMVEELWIHVRTVSPTTESDLFFRPFKDELMYQQAAQQTGIAMRKLYTKKDLQLVKKHYAHLPNAWYPDYDVETALTACFKANARFAKGNDAAYQAKMNRLQQLVMSGQYEAAAQYNQNSVASALEEKDKKSKHAAKADNWARLLNCLEEADKHDYQTEISINLLLDHFVPRNQSLRLKSEQSSNLPSLNDAKKLLNFGRTLGF